MVDVPRPVVSEQNPFIKAEQHTEYQSKICSCLWIVSFTRPDRLFAINVPSRYTHSPTFYDMKAIDKVLQYILVHRAWINFFHLLRG